MDRGGYDPLDFRLYLTDSTVLPIFPPPATVPSLPALALACTFLLGSDLPDSFVLVLHLSVLVYFVFLTCRVYSVTDERARALLRARKSVNVLSFEAESFEAVDGESFEAVEVVQEGSKKSKSTSGTRKEDENEDSEASSVCSWFSAALRFEGPNFMISGSEEGVQEEEVQEDGEGSNLEDGEDDDARIAASSALDDGEDENAGAANVSSYENPKNLLNAELLLFFQLLFVLLALSWFKVAFTAQWRG